MAHCFPWARGRDGGGVAGNPGSGPQQPGCTASELTPTFPGQSISFRAQQSCHVCACPRGIHITHSLRDGMASCLPAHRTAWAEGGRPWGSAYGSRASAPSPPARDTGSKAPLPLCSGGCGGLRSASSPSLLRLPLPAAVFRAPFHGREDCGSQSPAVQTKCFPVCIFCAVRTHIWNLARRASD